MANFVMGIISLTIGVVVLANVFITFSGMNKTEKIRTVKSTNTTSWSASEIERPNLLTDYCTLGIANYCGYCGNCIRNYASLRNVRIET